MNESDKRMAAYALESMFKSKSFDICTVRDAAKVMGREAGGPAMDRLKLLHCQDWDDIPADIMQMIPVWINEALGGPRLSAVQIPALREGNDHLIGTEDTIARLEDHS